MDKDLHVYLLIMVMALTTYLIRLIPFLFFKKKIKSQFVNSMLYYIPFAVLTAMTFPTVFFVTGNVYSSIFGTVVAIIASVSKRSLLVVAVLAVVAILIFNGISFII